MDRLPAIQKTHLAALSSNRYAAPTSETGKVLECMRRHQGQRRPQKNQTTDGMHQSRQYITAIGHTVRAGGSVCIWPYLCIPFQLHGAANFALLRLSFCALQAHPMCRRDGKEERCAHTDTICGWVGLWTRGCMCACESVRGRVRGWVSIVLQCR